MHLKIEEKILGARAKSRLTVAAVSEIGSRLKEEREAAGMTQLELAALGGVGKRSQINYEKGVRVPDAEYLARVDRRIDVRYVLTGRGVPNFIAIEDWLADELGADHDDADFAGLVVEKMEEVLQSRPVPLDPKEKGRLVRDAVRLRRERGARTDAEIAELITLSMLYTVWRDWELDERGRHDAETDHNEHD